jgi:ABC-type Fe3+ transport system permease subunit
VLESVIAIAVGVAIAFAWLAIWVVVLRAFGIPVLTRTPEEQAVKKQHILQMGKLRYILIFGVLGNGFALGLGIAIAIAVIMKHGSANWGEAATIFGVVSLVTGCINGMRTWSDLFRKEVPFPPLYSPPK